MIEKLLKKIIEKELFFREYKSNTKFCQKAKTYIKLKRNFNLDGGIYYTCTVPNFSCSRKNKILAIFRALEHESIGMAKYNITKELIEHKKIKNFHY